MNHADEDRRLSSPSLWILRVVLAIRVLGLGASYLWHPMERESAIYGTLFFELGWPESYGVKDRRRQPLVHGDIWVVYPSSSP